MERIIVWAAFVASLASSAHADNKSSGAGLEFSYLIGSRSYNASNFSRIDGDAAPSALEDISFGKATVAGVGIDLRIAVNGFRFSIGYAKPYVQGAIRVEEATDVGSVMKVRSIDGGEAQFGLGFEHDVDLVAIFVDVVGTADVVDADVVVGETQQGTYRSRGFGFSASIGARRAIHDVFYLHIGGAVGLTGDRSYNGVFGIGFGKF